MSDPRSAPNGYVWRVYPAVDRLELQGCVGECDAALIEPICFECHGVAVLAHRDGGFGVGCEYCRDTGFAVVAWRIEDALRIARAHVWRDQEAGGPFGVHGAFPAE